jgi:hypothetical protein
MKDFLIDGLWVLDYHSGICIFEENYRDWSTDLSTDLISSFLTAILSFANEAFIDAIQFIQFANHKIIFEFNEHALFVIAVSDSHISEEQLKATIEKVANKFIKKFQDFFEKGKLKGNIKQFNEFSEDLKKIVKKEPLSKKLITTEQIERLQRKREERRMRRREEQKRFL